METHQGLQQQSEAIRTRVEKHLTLREPMNKLAIVISMTEKPEDRC